MKTFILSEESNQDNGTPAKLTFDFSFINLKAIIDL